MEHNTPLVDKYRPKKLSDIVGQDVVVRILKNSFKSKNWHHAYILEGVLGSGKTSVSRIMAAMENCENGPTLEPCGICSKCVEIFKGRFQDVKEVDAASNRSIENIRDLQKEIYLNPIYSSVKYVIIDEAHGLTGYAADAALKMIEEPPPYVRFVLCTTQPESFKSTIPSRCITLNFIKTDWNILYKHLLNISKLEKIDCDNEALEIAARAASGSVRNAVRNLQTMWSYAGYDKITADMARKSLGTVDNMLYFKFIKNILDLNAPDVMKIVNVLMVEGGNVGKIVDGITDYIRNLQIYLIGGKDLLSSQVSDEEIKQFASQSNKAKPSLINKMIGLLVDVRRGLVVNMDAQALIENFAVGSMMEVVKLGKNNQEKK